jgi:hypothetical protein
MSNAAAERESFRRVSDTLEILQLNIDTHLRDLHTHRVFHLNSPPTIPSPTESDFLPSTMYQPEQQRTQGYASESRASTPVSFELPIMQFESPPASSDPVCEPKPESSESSEQEFFEESPFQLDITSLRAFFNSVAPNPVTEAYEPPELESIEVPIMLDIASVQAFSSPMLPSSVTELPELSEPASFEVPILLDVASVQAHSNPVAERSEPPNPDTFEIPEMSSESSPAVSSSVPAYDSIYESIALPPPEYFERPTTLDESLAVVPSNIVDSDAEPPSPNSDNFYPSLVTYYPEHAARQSDLSAYHSDIGARHSVLAAREPIIAAQQPNLAAHYSNLAARHSNIATRYFDIAAEYSQLMAEYANLAIHPPDLLAIHPSNLLHPGIGSPHIVASGSMAPGLEPANPHLMTRSPHADNSSSVSHGHPTAPRTPLQPNLTASIEIATAGDEPTPFDQGFIPNSPERMVQTWLQRQQVLVGIPIDQIQSVAIFGHQQVHRAAPRIVLTEEGAFARRLPPIGLNATNNPALSTAAVSSNTSNEPIPLTATTSAPGSGLAVSSHALDGSRPSASTISAAGSSSAVWSTTTNAPSLSTAAINVPGSSSAIGTLPTSSLGSPVGTGPTTVPSSPVGRVPTLNQLVLIAPEELAIPITPTRSAVRPERVPTRGPFSNHVVGSSDLDPRLARVRVLPRSSSSLSALSSPVIMPSSSVVASWDLPFRPIPPVDSSSTSDSESALQRTWPSRHAPEGMYQDPCATVFLTPLASFVATQSNSPTPSVLSSGPLGVVNRDEADFISSNEEVEVIFPSSDEELNSPRSLREVAPEEGVKSPNGGSTSGVHSSAQRRFLIDGANDSPDKAIEPGRGEKKAKKEKKKKP